MKGRKQLRLFFLAKEGCRAQKWKVRDLGFRKVRFQTVLKKRLRIFLDPGAKSLRKIRKNEVGGKGDLA